MARRFRLDASGVAAIMQSQAFARLVNEAANKVASSVSTPKPAEVKVEQYSTDRQAAAVIVRHPKAAGWQAKHGTLTSAAAMAGLRVRSR